jgi:hypothetical protein
MICLVETRFSCADLLSQRIYDLWQGTIQSQDGALQLLLIVDYIWSWARDIYRPTIRTLLANSLSGTRGFSPASTDRFRQSISLSCTTSPAPNSQDQNLMQLDQATSNPEERTQDSRADEPEDDDYRSFLEPQYAEADSFLRWAPGHRYSPAWTTLGSIRHADIIQFEFAVYRTHGAELESPALPTFLMTPTQLQQVTSLWPKPYNYMSEPELGDLVQVGFVFHTFCNPSTWQIIRVLSCAIWGANFASTDFGTDHVTVVPFRASEIKDGPPMLVRLHDLRNALLDVRELRGRQSIIHALQGVARVLSLDDQDPGWVALEDACEGSNGMVETVSQTIFDNLAPQSLRIPTMGGIDVKADRHAYTRVFSRVRRIEQQRSPSTIPHLSQDTKKSQSIIAIRSPNWQTDCPLFCLFVLHGDIDGSERSLHQLLVEAVETKSFFGHSSFRWDPDASRTIGKWRKALADAAEKGEVKANMNRSIVC